MTVDWIESIRTAIDFIEENMEDELSIDKIAEHVYLSPFYFQRGFTMLCGYTVGEYIRRRRLALAGSELAAKDVKIIDLAIKYGYDSPDSFTRAFTRFHGVTPTAVRKEGALIKTFSALTIKFTLEGGITMDYRIVNKEAFTVVGIKEDISYESAYRDIPALWDKHCSTGRNKLVGGMFGVSTELPQGGEKFSYMIADNYMPWEDIPDGLEARTIAAHTWAVFPCRGPLPESLQKVNTQIFSQWLPNSKEYQLDRGNNIELYSNYADYPKGLLDENYYSEIWIPVKKK